MSASFTIHLLAIPSFSSAPHMTRPVNIMNPGFCIRTVRGPSRWTRRAPLLLSVEPRQLQPCWKRSGSSSNSSSSANSQRQWTPTAGHGAVVDKNRQGEGFITEGYNHQAGSDSNSYTDVKFIPAWLKRWPVTGSSSGRAPGLKRVSFDPSRGGGLNGNSPPLAELAQH